MLPILGFFLSYSAFAFTNGKENNRTILPITEQSHFDTIVLVIHVTWSRDLQVSDPPLLDMLSVSTAVSLH